MGKTDVPHYVETRIEVPQDPLVVAARLAEAGPHGEFVIYEDDGQWSYAGGVLADVRLDREGARLSGVREARLPWSERPLRQVAELFSTLPVRDWRAYGTAMFELSYAKDGNQEHLADQCLLHLVVPKSEVRLASGQALVRSTDPDTLAVLVELLTGPIDSRARYAIPIDVRRTGRDEYCGAVASAVREITDAQLQKVILSRLVDVDRDIDLVATYVLGRRQNTPARSFLLHMDGLEAAGFSPEIVVGVTAEGKVVSQPLAGTRALTSDTAENSRRRVELLSSEKEIYEHAISVKVGNDELLTVCEPDSVGVRNLMTVEERGSVQHLASRVTGQLAEGLDAWDAFAAVFPAVTASGVPKEAAYEAIRRHETERRGLYGGAVLTVDASGALDAALVLRTVYRQHGRTWLRAGAGIVGQSQPAREFEETCEKLDSIARFLVAGETKEEVHA
ncbi:salicylate synthase [Streptomyces odontomachi]|uniref:salicylate synthase n=1 Tax=Streptomyces odontomachi TaxID=2944940 RepID=UPI00210C1F43|nr:salicylate synthase [Streptomyces sp. ODS25]